MASSNTALLRAAQYVAPPEIDISLFDEIGNLPYFNPDQEDILPTSVQLFRAEVGRCDGLLLSTPEYAHGLPGCFKNALDWLVGGPEFMGKPVAILNASEYSVYAQANLVESVTIMSGKVVQEACATISVRGSSMSPAQMAADPKISFMLDKCLNAFVSAIQQMRTQEGKSLPV